MRLGKICFHEKKSKIRLLELEINMGNNEIIRVRKKCDDKLIKVNEDSKGASNIFNTSFTNI